MSRAPHRFDRNVAAGPETPKKSKRSRGLPWCRSAGNKNRPVRASREREGEYFQRRNAMAFRA
ncbi:MAG TPA: hypothetical protein ACQGQH_03075 [Xylella sp.]